MKTLLVVEGPTASGKTKLAVDLAKKLQTVVFSADSRQFYREMSIGTAKPSEEEMQGIRHFFIDTHSIFHELTAATFAREADQSLSEQFAQHNTIILAGGSGMYVNALCHGLDDIPTNARLRQELVERLEQDGVHSLLLQIKDIDPSTYHTIDKANPARVIRALEAMQLTGKPFSQLKTGLKKQHHFRVIRIVLSPDRSVLYERINQRVDQMMTDGLLKEVMDLFPHRSLPPLRTVGYRELFEYLEGKSTLSVAVDLIRQHTRNYAKRQMTWLRKNNDAACYNPDEYDNLAELILDSIQK